MNNNNIVIKGIMKQRNQVKIKTSKIVNKYDKTDGIFTIRVSRTNKHFSNISQDDNTNIQLNK